LEVLAHEFYVHVDPVLETLERIAAGQKGDWREGKPIDHKMFAVSETRSEPVDKMLALIAAAPQKKALVDSFKRTALGDLGFEAARIKGWGNVMATIADEKKFKEWIK
jgi:hypothetical protein